MKDLPITALIRHICYISALKIFEDSKYEELLLDALKCCKRVAWLHPIQVIYIVFLYLFFNMINILIILM